MAHEGAECPVGRVQAVRPSLVATVRAAAESVSRLQAHKMEFTKTESEARMTADTKRLVLHALRSVRGDDYERAQYAFRTFTPSEMQNPHGESGQTRHEILDAYRRHVKMIDAAIAEVERTA